MDRYLGQYSQSVRHAVVGQVRSLPAAIDDQTTAYILETRLPFEDLRQVAAQMAGLLVLAASGSRSAGPHHPMITAAAALHGDAVETVARVRVPPGAREHHRYLLEAAAELGRALAAAKSGIAIDPILLPLRAAYDRLQLASRSLPGFPMVAWEQGCCGQGPTYHLQHSARES
jgi:hypothetical protein